MSDANQHMDESYVDKNYLRHAKQFDLLESEEEFVLAKKWRDQMDPEAAHRLISAHLRLVGKIAKGYRGYGLPMAELISEGHIGMMQALKRFDPEKGFRFSTYAMWWVKAHMQQFILNSWSLVKIGTTPQQRKLFFNLRKLKNALGVSDSTYLDDASRAHIAEKLNVSHKEIDEMNSRLSQPDHSLNVTSSHEGEGEWQDLLMDEAQDHEAALLHKDELDKRRKVLEQSLGILNPREHEILKRRRLVEPPETLETLSQDLGVSRERVRQIEVRAFEKLQQVMVSHPLVTGERGTAAQANSMVLVFWVLTQAR
jgi:RNA polymerase sigma-32 factor